MMNQDILVSIIIPTFNRAHLLSETLDSVLAQTYLNWECIIIDDHSTDNTDVVLQDYLKKDARFVFIKKSKKQPQGASISRNIGLHLANGKYIQFLDSDDILAENKIENQVTILQKENNTAIAVCRWEEFHAISDEIKTLENKADYRNFDNCKDYFDLIGTHGGFYPPESFLISQELISIAGNWNENLTINDDGEFFFRIILNSSKILFTENTYVLHRNANNDNLSILNSEAKAIQLVSSWKIIEKLYLEKFNEQDALYLNKKKQAVYNELIKKYPKIIKENSSFFKKQIKQNTITLRLRKVRQRAFNKLKVVFKVK